jgi:acetylornithine deacetylase/succinyl-diaminopimelate desuccinylase-like protein
VDEPDAVGNVCARRGDALPAVILAAHMDTVFPADTQLRITRDGDRITGPGISDNARGLAAIIRIAAALDIAQVRTRRAIHFIGTVGEEGAGDLRGVKYLFAGDVTPAAFVAVDGAGISRIVHRAVGSRRLRVTVNGEGGHSWIDRGVAHPVHALAAGIAAVKHSATSHSSFSVGRIEGGTGINVIPTRAFADVDIRSEDAGEVSRIESAFRNAIEAAVESENAERKSGSASLSVAIEVTGDRPGGAVSADDHIVRCAWEATRYCGAAPELTSSSTDANVPISRCIPAIAIGAGGDAGGMHTLSEWYSNRDGVRGLRRLLILTLLLAGLD